MRNATLNIALNFKIALYSHPCNFARNNFTEEENDKESGDKYATSSLGTMLHCMSLINTKKIYHNQTNKRLTYEYANKTRWKHAQNNPERVGETLVNKRGRLIFSPSYAEEKQGKIKFFQHFSIHDWVSV